MNWTNTIRKAVRDSGLSMYAVAKRAKLDYPRVYLFMHGGGVTLPIAEKLAKAVGLELRPSARRRKAKDR